MIRLSDRVLMTCEYREIWHNAQGGEGNSFGTLTGPGTGPNGSPAIVIFFLFILETTTFLSYFFPPSLTNRLCAELQNIQLQEAL